MFKLSLKMARDAEVVDVIDTANSMLLRLNIR